MVQSAEASEWPEGFIADAAIALSVIDDIHAAAPALVDQPLDPDAQDWMRRVLEHGRIERANAAAGRIVRLQPAQDGARS